MFRKIHIDKCICKLMFGYNEIIGFLYIFRCTFISRHYWSVPNFNLQVAAFENSYIQKVTTIQKNMMNNNNTHVQKKEFIFYHTAYLDSRQSTIKPQHNVIIWYIKKYLPIHIKILYSHKKAIMFFTDIYSLLMIH